MFVIIGIAVVLLSVLGGFVLHGGPLGVLFQPEEFLIIGGAAMGALLVQTPPSLLKRVASNMGGLFKGDPYTKDEYLNLLKTMFELFNAATRDGLIAIEQHVEKPEASSIFAKNKFLMHHKHALYYLADTMKLLMGGGVPPHDLESMLEADIETHHTEETQASGMLQKVADALPGLGIVAAVLGIVITMQAIDGPPAEIGYKVAAALVGTFLGIFLCYGFVGPMSTHMDLLSQSQSRYFECMKAGIVAYAKGNAPLVVVEFARRVIPNEVRPAFQELEQAVKALKHVQS
ncbi:MAG: flagellar motor stator protein MotA [Bacteroidetes bacterium]|nr:flagellar motor stator protein MotA [Bacteroidota bacterium]MCW5895076.1 flagellar motor stator protein MotA [Bacteroidota bacterium]